MFVLMKIQPTHIAMNDTPLESNPTFESIVADQEAIKQDIELFRKAYEGETDPELKAELREEWMIACHSWFMLEMFAKDSNLDQS